MQSNIIWAAGVNQVMDLVTGWGLHWLACVAGSSRLLLHVAFVHQQVSTEDQQKHNGKHLVGLVGGQVVEQITLAWSCQDQM
jgi:hypothetical protein